MNNSRLVFQERIQGKFQLVASGALIGLALLLRLDGLSKSIWIDEGDTLRKVREMSIPAMIGYLRRYDNHPPLYFVLIKLWSVFGVSAEIARLLSVLAGVAMVFALWLWLKPKSPLAALIAGLLAATLPTLLSYSQDARSYSFLLLLVTLAFYFAERWARHPSQLINYAALTFIFTLSIATELTGVLLIAPIAVFIWLTTVGAKKILWRYLTILAILVFGEATVLTAIFQEGISKIIGAYWMPPLSFNLIAEIAYYASGFANLFQYWVRLNLASGFIASATFLGLLALIAVITFLGKWQMGFPYLAAALIYWLQLFLYSMIIMPITWTQTILPGLVPLIAFIAIQIATIPRRGLRATFIAGALVLCALYAFTWVTHDSAVPVEEWRVATNIVRSEWQPDSVIIFYPFYVELPMDYYFPALPQDAVIGIRLPATHTSLTDAVKLNSTEIQTNKPRTIFLVTYMDIPAETHTDTYRELLILLKSQIHQPTRLKNFVIMGQHSRIQLSLKQTRDELLDNLRSEFGEPTQFQDAGNYAITEYQITGAP